MEVGQVVQHRGIEEIRLADSKVCSTCLEEQHNVLVAQELRKDEGLVKQVDEEHSLSFSLPGPSGAFGGSPCSRDMSDQGNL